MTTLADELLNAATLEATRVQTGPKIDGRMDDPCWQQAEPVKSFWAYDRSGRRDDLAEAKVLYDDTHLYVGYRMALDEGYDAAGDAATRNGEVWQIDSPVFRCLSPRRSSPPCISPITSSC